MSFTNTIIMLYYGINNLHMIITFAFRKDNAFYLPIKLYVCLFCT